MVNRGLNPNLTDPRADSLRSPGPRPCVLVVDDDAGILGLMSVILGRQYNVKMASDGNAALDVAESEDLDAIILDLRMPVLDGRGFFRELRARGDTTPVLLASSHGARAAQQELGAEGAIEKPFEPDALMQALGRLID